MICKKLRAVISEKQCAVNHRKGQHPRSNPAYMGCADCERGVETAKRLAVDKVPLVVYRPRALRKQFRNVAMGEFV